MTSKYDGLSDHLAAIGAAKVKVDHRCTDGGEMVAPRSGVALGGRVGRHGLRALPQRACARMVARRVRRRAPRLHRPNRHLPAAGAVRRKDAPTPHRSSWVAGGVAPAWRRRARHVRRFACTTLPQVFAAPSRRAVGGSKRMAQSGHKEWRVGATRHRRKERRGCVWGHTLCASGRSLVDG